MKLWISIVVSGLVASCWGVRPLVTDDARITPPHECQIESWMKNGYGLSEVWIMPACNPEDNLEITVGSGKKLTAPYSADYILQLKTLIKPFDEKSYGIGLVGGVVAHPDIAIHANQIGNSYFFIPVSVALSDRIIVHTNLGLSQLWDQGQTLMTWGVGYEVIITPQLMGIGEFFGDDHHGGYGHGGVRYWLIPNHLQIDMTVGHHVVQADGWVSIGLRMIGF